MSRKRTALTKTQLGIYMECMSNPQRTTYNLPYLVPLKQETDIGKLYCALEQLMQIHPVLDCRIIADPSGEICIEGQVGNQVIRKSLSDDDFAEHKDKLVRPFAIDRDILARFEIYETPSQSYLFCDFHHVVFDGTSITLFFQNLELLYLGETVPEETSSIFEVSEEEMKLRETEHFYEEKAYYASILEGYDPDSTPVQDRYEEVPVQKWISKEFEMDSAALKNRRMIAGASTTAIYATALGLLIARYNAANTSVISTAFSGREDERIADTFGMFVKTIPFVLDLSKSKTSSDLLHAASQQLQNSRRRTLYSYMDLAGEYGLVNDINFVYHGKGIGNLFYLNENSFMKKAERIYDSAHIEETKLVVEIADLPSGKCLLHLGYRGDFYSDAFAENLAASYIHVIEGLVRGDELSEITLVDDVQLAVLNGFNETDCEYDTEHTVVDLFRQMAIEYPDQPAVVYKEKCYTYRELDQMTDFLAFLLKQKGIGTEKVAAILIPRSEYMVITSMGSLKAGGAYMPLDPTYPPERLNFMVQDSQAEILITTRELDTVITEEFQGIRIYLEDLENEFTICSSEEREQLIQHAPKGPDRFIMLYTSGTTGLPKGVVLEHGNLMAFSAWMRRFYQLGCDCRIAAYASFGFDACMHDMFPALTAGAAVHIIAEEIRLDLPAVYTYFKEQKITHTLMTTQIGRQFAFMGNPGSLRLMSTGGEKLASIDPPDYLLCNAYGPTEGTVLCTIKPLDRRYKDIPIGKVIDNFKGYIVDCNGNRLPVGAAGELWIAGPQVSREYLNQPEKTAQSYLDNPFCREEKYNRCYRTGDIVRYLEDGEIQFIGRRDGQVKVRGFRIELAEVEEIIRRFPGIKDATTAAYDDPAGGKYICAYVVVDQKISVEEMNQFILAEKPPYMVPAVTMQIDAIPYTQNQKVNKRALPKPERQVENLTPPENETQEKIFKIVAALVGHEQFSIDTDLQIAGLTSIGIVQLNVELYKAFDVSFTIADIRENQTVRKLEAFLSASFEEKLEEQESYALTKTQMGVFAECMGHPGSTIYNIPLAYCMDPSLDISKVKQAVVKSILAHPYLLSTLSMDGTEGIRLNRPAKAIFTEDMIEILEGEFEDVKAELVKPYNLMKDRLFRIALIRGSSNYLFLDMHHLISDGTSLNILLDDISKSYLGQDPEVEKFSGYEVSLLEEERLLSNQYDRAKSYYQNLLAGADTECIPPRVVRSEEGESSFCRIPAGLSAEQLKAFCTKNGISMATLFNGAFGLALGKYTFKEDVLYTTIYNGRSDPRMARTISMLVKTFPVRCELKGETAVLDYLKGLGDQMLSSMANDLYSFAEIAHDEGVNADILFTYQGELFAFDTFCGKPCKSVALELDQAKAKMDIDVVVSGDKVYFECYYRSDLFNEAFMTSLLGAVAKAAEAFSYAGKLNEISLVTDSMKKLLDSFNDTTYPVSEESVNCMFERQAALHPEQKAVIAGGQTLTYGQLNALANRAAHALIKRGVKADEIVGLITGRTVNVFIGELAILKAGAAFLPMVPEYPNDRIHYCLEDASSRYVITTEAIRQEKQDLFDGKDYQVLTFESLLLEENEDNPSLSIDPASLAYCIYTSGSTGTPKGVMIEHRNLRNFLDPNQKNPETGNYVKVGHTILSVISISFDFSLMEVQLPICNGLTVCMADEDEIHDPLALARLMEEYGVDVMSCTPSFIGNMIDIPQVAKALGGMRLFDFGAEAFPPKLFEKLRIASPNALICNGYGPTETTISCISKVLDSGEGITIGRPAANVQAYVCDHDMQPLPWGACGELVIGGKGVGRGYVELPDKTAAVFVELDGQRVYRSGDVVRFQENGEIEFFGRFDNQVKLRGFRVELDEIENNINTFPGIKVSKVVVRNNGSEDYLAAFFTADQIVNIAELTAHLKEKLTYYMVPSVLMQLDVMPLTVNGKIDKKKLPAVEFHVQRNYVEPEEGLETEICKIFGDILKQEKIGATDNFFEIGGTSLTATMIVLRLGDLGHSIVYKDVFEYSTPRDLMHFITGGKLQKGFSDDFDYHDIDELLQYNTMEFVDDFEMEEVEDIILTGASGFLGIHILKAFLDQKRGKAYCLIRKGRYDSPMQRLQNMMMYYYGSSMVVNARDRIVCIDGDITDSEQLKVLADLDAKVVINCAALVKHFVNDDSLDRVNVHGVENLVDLCVESGKRLIQISTTSVGGMLPKERKSVKITEDKLWFNQIIDNDYIRTKFLAERAVLQARKTRGLDGLIIRVGNLMSRNSDGEFQINFITNGFMRSLKAFKQLGAFPISSMHNLAEFSPIDSTASAILNLAGVRGKFSVFHANNSHLIYMSDVIRSMQNYGFDIQVVFDEKFGEIIKEAAKDDRMSDVMLGLIAYDTGDQEPVFLTEDSNRFTVEVLYRVGYLWPITDNRYLDNVIRVLDGFDFFELD